MTLTTKSGATVMSGEPMTGGYAHNGQVRHISNDFGSKQSVCGKELEYTIQMASMDIATCKRCRKAAGVVAGLQSIPCTSDVTDAYFILMYNTGIGMQQVAETGIFHSKTQANNFVTYNGHLLINDAREKVDPTTVRVYKVLEA